MAKLNNDLLNQQGNGKYNVNAYTIQYDKKVKRFFKVHGPNVVGGSLVGTAAFAALTAVTALVGGAVGLGVGAIVGASTAIGAATTVGYNARLNRKNNDIKPRFKSMNIENEDERDAMINNILHSEAKAYEYSQLLELYPSQKKFPLQDGEYSRSDLKHKIKRNEDIAYCGIKEMLKQGVIYSEKINALEKQTHLTEDQKDDLKNYRKIMDYIEHTVAKITSQRTQFNPYKGLVIDAIQQGCLLGDDYQNTQIKAVASVHDRDLATKLYANMYEQPILKKIQAERKKTAELEEQINKEGKETARIRTEIINRDGDIAKISKENRKLAKQITELTSYQVLIDTAKRLSKTLPQELNDEKQMLDNSIEGFKVSIDTNDNKAINANKVALDQMVDVISDKLVSVKARKQVVISAQKQVNAYKKVLLKQKSQINQLEDAVDIAQDVAYEINQKYEKSVKRNLNKRAENKYWKNRAESAENAVNVLSDTQLEAQYWQDRAQNAETNVDIMYNNLLNSEEKYKKSVKRNLNKRAENKYWKNRAESAENAVNALSDTQLEAQYWQDRAQNAENTVNVVYDNLTETEQQLSQSKAQASKYKSKSKKATRLIAKLVNDTQVQQTENDRLQQEKELAGIFLDGFMEENEILKTELDDTKKAKDETTKQLDRAKKANKRVADKLESINKKHMASKVKIKEQDNIIKAQGEKINNLNEDVDNLVNAQSQNIATISELEIDKDILQDKLTKETSRAKANEDLAINLGYDLQRTQRELDALTSERDAYKKGVEDLEDEKRELKKQLEQALDRADILQAREDAKNANFVRGGLLRNLNNLVDKIDAHIEYTKEVQKDNCDKELLKELQGFTNIVRRKDQNEMSNEDIALSNQVLKKTYGVYRDKLAKVSSEKLRQVIKDKVNSRKINLTK